MRYCTQCGEAARPEQAFCVHCGSQLGQPAQHQAPASAPHSGSGPTETHAAAHPRSPYHYPEPGLPGSARASSAPVPVEAEPLSPAQSWPQPAAEGRKPVPVISWPPPPPIGNQPGGAPGEFRAPENQRRSRLGVIVAIAAAVLILGGAVVGWKVLSHTSARHVTSGHAATSPTQPSSASTSTASPTGSPSLSSGTTDPGHNPGAVAMAQAVSQQADAPRVATFLGRYFSAINNHDYALYSSLFVPEMRSSFQNFETGYRSTSDSRAVLTGISPVPGGVAASVSFTSHQHPADSPTGTACTSWDITLYLEPHGGTYWIMHAPPGYHAQYQAC